MAKKTKKVVPTANVREDRIPVVSQDVDAIEVGTRRTPVASAPGTSPQTFTAPSQGTAVADPNVNVREGRVEIAEGARKPSGIAGADLVYRAGVWVLEPMGGGTFTQAPGGGLTVAQAQPSKKESEPAPEDAIFRIAVAKLSQYGLSGVADALRKARNDYPELDVDDLLFLVENDDKYNKPFKDRFKANAARELKGLPKLSAAAYLEMEQGYKKLFSTYNLPMFSNQGQFDKLIAGDVDIDDATDRVVKAYDRVLTDTSTRNAFRQFYGTLTDSDIVSALLDPEQQMPALEKKVVAAEIGGQALRQGLATGLKPVEAMVTPEGRQVSGYSNVQRGSLGAQALAGEGVDEAAAAAGYEEIASRLPEAEKLSSIYAKRAEQYGQKEAEQESLLKMASAQRKREKLTAIERATFSGEAGTMRTSLGRRGRGGAF